MVPTKLVFSLKVSLYLFHIFFAFSLDVCVCVCDCRLLHGVKFQNSFDKSNVAPANSAEKAVARKCQPNLRLAILTTLIKVGISQ